MAKIEARFHFRNRAVRRARPGGPSATLGLLALLASLPALAPAQGAPRPEQVIKWRQSAYQVIAWNSARIKAALAGKYDAREVQAAANTLAALASAGVPALFPHGTERGKGWRETTARASVFSDAAAFRQRSDEFARESALLAKLAAGVDPQAVRDQFLKVAQTCKSCHDKFRQTD
jgi:cytochrome c556